MWPFNWFRSRDKPQNRVSSAMQFFFGYGTSGEEVTPRTAMQLSTVYACVRVISDAIATMSLHVYERLDNGGKRKALTHPLDRIIHSEPNREMTSYIWRETMMSHLLLWGNAYNQIVYNMRGNVIGLYPLLPDKMRVDRDEITHKIKYTYTDMYGETHELSPDEVLHIPGLGFDGLVGYSPIAMERNAISLGVAAEKYGAGFFGNSAIPAGILEHPGTMKDPGKLRKAWHEAYGGAGNAKRVAILEEGMKFHQISIPNNEAQFLETRKFQVEEICRIYQVPPHMVGNLDHATFSNIEHQEMEFVKHTIDPWIARIEQAMDRALFHEGEKARYTVRFNVDTLLRGDFKTRMEAYQIGRQNGFYSTNDFREMEGWEPVPEEEGGDTYFVNGNMIPLNIAMTGDHFSKLQKKEGGEDK